MGCNLAQKIIAAHLTSGTMVPGQEIGLRIDQTLTQDATGTMTYLQFEAMDLPRVRTELSVSYVDHNMLQTDFRNADDHRYLQSVAAKYGILFSRPGNGICHQVHLERFSRPGITLLGADSHTPTSGGLGALAIGAGGLDVAIAMAGAPFYVPMPRVLRVVLSGTLQPWVSAKDVILELLRRLTVKGGVGKIIEYTGPGVATLSVPERASITNMGAELGATSSIFPSDDITRAYLAAQGRAKDWQPLAADPDATYDETVEIDLGALVPLAAVPHSPDAVVPVEEIAGQPVQQVCIGSCTNSSVRDLETVAAMLRGRTIAPGVSLVINPGSRQVLTMVARSGALADLIAAGARVMDPGCGPCIGMGQSPRTDAVSLRTNNRNFFGRSGTASAQVYLVSPEVAAASALTGVLTDPRDSGTAPVVAMPDHFFVNDNMIIDPAPAGEDVPVVRGPNIQPFPVNRPLQGDLAGKALIKVEDNITTDHIMPSNAKLLPFRSNIPYLADFCLAPCDPQFPARAKANGGGFIIAGTNYGQGSSREHAALAPLQLGVKAVLAKSFARIHMANLINNGILPLSFVRPEDYDGIGDLDDLVIEQVEKQLEKLVRGEPLLVKNLTQDTVISCELPLSRRQADVLLAGGLLNFTRRAT